MARTSSETLQSSFAVFIFVIIFCFNSVDSLCIDCTYDTSISWGAVIAIIVGGLILITAIPILCCFCCACCCFSGRNKNKTNVYLGGPGNSTTNQQINMIQNQNHQRNQESYPSQSYGNSAYPSQQQQQHQPQYPTAYPSGRDAAGNPSQQNYPQSPSYPSDPSYPQNAPSYPYPLNQSPRIPPSPSKLPPYSPMNHSRVATPLVAQLSPYPPSPSQDYGSPSNSTGLRRAHSSAGYGSQQPLYPSNLTPSALGLQRSPSYLGAGSPPQPFYPNLHQQQPSGLRRSPSAASPTSYPHVYDNKAYTPNMNQGYGFQDKY